MKMELRLKELIIQDFAGVRDEGFKFDGKDAKVFGDNATGKTTTAVAINWLLFDKGLESQKVDVVPKYDNNEHIHEKVPYVQATFEYNGTEIVLARSSHPNYEKVEGSSKKHYKNSRTTKQYIDEVPFPITKYKAEVSKMIDEEVFKLVTNPEAFPQLHWQDKRKILFEISGDFTDEQVIASSKELQPLLEVIKNKSVEDQKKIIKEKLSKAKEDLEYIPVQIRTLNDQLSENTLNLSSNQLADRQVQLNESLEKLNEQRLTVQNGGAALEIKRVMSEKQFELDNLKRELEGGTKDKVSGLERELSSLESDLKIFDSQTGRISAEIQTLNADKEDKLKTYHELIAERNDKEMERFHSHVDNNCPTCKQALPEQDIENAHKIAEEKFNVDKSNQLERLESRIQRIVADGKSLAAAVEKNKERRNDIDTQELTTKKRIETVKKQLDNMGGKVVDATENESYKQLQAEIGDLEIKLGNDIMNVEEQVGKIDVQAAEIKAQLNTVNDEIAAVRAEQRIKESIEEYHAKEDKLLDVIEDLKHQKYLLDQFVKTKVNLITEKVNSMFEVVKFKLFHTQVNGDIKETCEIMVDGVTYDGGLNNAARVNAGVDITNALSKHYGINLFMFVDNSESVTQLLESQAQQIQLIVSENDKTLRMETV